tara:strand:- start:1500 stop:2642 length:1143 start_codon:yes stop_codon:yes gene_type:complete
MHKLESFALSTASKISKPFLEKLFYPIVDKKFICVSQNSPESSKSYDYYNDVIFHIKPFLEQNEIEVIELGQSELGQVFYSKNYKHLNRLQAHYVISKSLLYVGNFNIYAHLASHCNKDIIFPSNKDYKNTFKPYWSSEDTCSILMSDSEGKPSLHHTESPKTINEVPPEVLACSILDKLNIDHDLGSIKTIYIGDLYGNSLIDLIPGNYSPSNLAGQNNINIRMDKNFDLHFLSRCSTLSNLVLITDKVIPQVVLEGIKDNINQVSFIINKDTTEEEVKAMQSIGKPVTLLTQDKNNLNKIRLNLIDYPVILYERKTKKELKTKTFSDLTFLSKRNVIKDGQAFNSYLSASKGKNVSSVSNKKEFWEDLPYCRVFKKSS